MNRSPCFGIDLGTTASAIGWVKDGVPTLLPVQGSALVPSVVYWPRDSDEVLVGIPARNAQAMEPERVVSSTKRDMGTETRYALGDREVTPVDVAEQVLRALIDGAERAVGVRPERAVITVPAWFTQAQRADTRAAGQRAGLTVERIVNEPTAAALAHAHGQDQQRTVLVYDLGGGTFDVSVVDQDGPVVEVRASHGDSRLGGDDLDEALVEHVLARVRADDPALGAAVAASRAARVRLRLAVEQAKIELSETLTTVVRVPHLVELDGRARHLELPVERAELDRLAEPLLQRTMRSVARALDDANLNPSDLDELILVGGATLQPRVWHTLHEALGLEGSHAIAPRDVVALGAAIQAAIVDGSRTDGILMDVAPYPLSVGVATGPLPEMLTHFRCRVMTPRNAPLPSRHTERFSTSHHRQRGVHLYVFQGSHPDPRRNALLGRLELDDLEPAPPGSAGRPLQVEFRHDLDGMVQITAADELSGRTRTARLAADGESQAELEAELASSLANTGLTLGDGADDEDGSDREDTEDDGEGALQDPSAGPAPSGPAEEAARLFAEVLAAEASLVAAHGEEGEAMVALCRAGAAAAGEAEALRLYDELCDRMFARGVYL